MQSLQCHALLNYINTCNSKEELKSLNSKIGERLEVVRGRKLLDKILPNGDIHNELLKEKVTTFERNVEENARGDTYIEYYITFQGGHIIRLNTRSCYLTRLLRTHIDLQEKETLAYSAYVYKGGNVPARRAYVLCQKEIIKFISDIGLEGNDIYREKIRQLIQGYIEKYNDVKFDVINESEYKSIPK